jgi:hypothetical protein
VGWKMGTGKGQRRAVADVRLVEWGYRHAKRFIVPVTTSSVTCGVFQ